MIKGYRQEICKGEKGVHQSLHLNLEVIEFGELIQTYLYSKHDLEWPEDTGMISKSQLIKQKLFMYLMTCILANSLVELILIKPTEHGY